MNYISIIFVVVITVRKKNMLWKNVLFNYIELVVRKWFLVENWFYNFLIVQKRNIGKVSIL